MNMSKIKNVMSAVPFEQRIITFQVSKSKKPINENMYFFGQDILY
jgi:hypothetical protein